MLSHLAGASDAVDPLMAQLRLRLTEKLREAQRSSEKLCSGGDAHAVQRGGDSNAVLGSALAEFAQASLTLDWSRHAPNRSRTPSSSSSLNHPP